MTSTITRATTRLLIGGVLGVCAAGAAVAQTTPAGNAYNLLNDRFVVNGGVFIVNSDVKAHLNGSSTINPDVNFDDTFGKASDATRGRIDALWRITPKHHLTFTYFNNDVTRSRVIDRDFQWGDVTYHAGGNVSAETDMSVYALSYEYAFLREPTYEVAASAGIHYTDFGFKLSGSGTITGSNGTSTGTATTQSRSNSLPAPLPVIGIRGGWVVAPQWYLDGAFQFFKLNVDGYDGNWTNLRLGGTWMFHRNLGVGLAYNRFATRVDVSRSNFNGRLDLGYSGVQAFLTGSF
jgi:hypothetical protein